MTHYADFGSGFGNVGTAQTVYGFTGEMLDGGGLLDLRARRYAPGLGVFASLDPFEGLADRPTSLNGYSWVEGNVVNAVDPSGKWGERPEQWDQCNDQVGVCTSFLYRDGYRYADCLMIEGLNPCPTGYVAPMEVPYPRCITENGLQDAGILWEKLWQSERQAEAAERCSILESKRDSLKAGTLDGCKRLVEIIKYAHEQFPYFDAVSLADDLSCALVNSRGKNTLTDSKYVETLDLGTGGWSEQYDDGTSNQAYHFWAYVNQVSQGGIFTAGFINYIHECWGVGPKFPWVFQDPGTTVEDVRLAIVGIRLGKLIASGQINASDLADWVERNVCNGAPPLDTLADDVDLQNIFSCPGLIIPGA